MRILIYVVAFFAYLSPLLNNDCINIKSIPAGDTRNIYIFAYMHADFIYKAYFYQLKSRLGHRHLLKGDDKWQTKRLDWMSQNPIDFHTWATDSDACVSSVTTRKYDADTISVTLHSGQLQRFVFVPSRNNSFSSLKSNKFVCVILKPRWFRARLENRGPQIINDPTSQCRNGSFLEWLENPQSFCQNTDCHHKVMSFVARRGCMISPITNKNNKNEASVLPHPLS